MAGNISGLHPFANDVGPVPLKLLDDSFSTLAITLNTLSTFSNFYSDTGTTNAYTIQTTQYQLVAYSDGLQVTVRIANTNTGASTLNVNGLGAMPILTSIGSELQPNALVAGSIVTFVYNAQRQAWQIGSGGAGGGQITAPLHVTNPTGQSALSINVDGSGYLGDFNGNGLSWDGSCNYTFEGGATLSGIKLPFTVMNADGTEPQLELRADGYSGLTAWPSGTAVNLEANGGGALGTPPSQLTWDTAGNWLFQSPSSLTVDSVIAPNAAFGTAPNQILIDSNGTLTTTGTATLPMPPLIDLPGINITNPQNGEALVYDQATNSWVNGAPVNALATLNDVALTAPANGQSLIYNNTTQRWVNSTAVLALEQLTNTHVSGPAPGQVLTYSLNPLPGWVNATIPGYNFLTSLGVGPAPQAGWVLTWDGVAWVGAAPGEVAQFPLSSLTDVGITTPLNRQVLTYDAPNAKWINAPPPTPSLATLPDVALTSQTQGQVLAWNAQANRWENSSLPGGEVIALHALMDTNISDPQNNQVLTWDYASGRWMNKTIATTLATLPDVTLAAPTDGQALVYDTTTSRWENSSTVKAPFSVYPVTRGAPSLVVGTDGGTTIGPPAGTNPTAALAISNPANFTNSNWCELITVNPSSTSNGMGIAGGAGTSTSFGVYDSTGTYAYLRVMGDGTGYVGPSGANRLEWDASNQWGLGVGPGRNVRLGVAAAANGNGLYVQGGGTTTGVTFAVYNNAGAQPRIRIQDDGSGYVGANSVNNMNWNAAGNFIFAPPISGGPTLTINTLSGQMSAVLQSAAGVTAGLSWAQAGRTAWQMLQDGGTDSWRLWNQNSGTVLSANNSGNVVVNTPSTGTAFTVNGVANAITMLVTSPNNTVPANQNWALMVQSLTSTVGTGYGLSIRAGVPGSPRDIPFQIMNTPGSYIMYCYSNGEIYFPLLSASSASTAGSIIRVVGTSGQLTWDPSAIRYKRDIRSLARQKAKELVAKLRVVSYRSKCELDDPDVTHYGLIAEEVAGVAPGLVALDKDGKPSGVQMDHLAMLLIPLVQELLGMDEPEGEVYG